ncbi:MAG: AbrB/MazE/SpoVT family DNA-binding domain-containing protein [archaeon]|nr:AbrB/MazE/SpoVT family DNA-binding domain-containing protein [archaeon]MCP8315709.1 AbrB/MazE/SpoVT family DNA-binding domain-containing protein [archaeon]
MAHIVLGVAKMSAKNRLTIPKGVRAKYGFKKGDLILFVEEEGKLVVKKGLMTRIG